VVKVYTSSVLDAPAYAVWSEIRDFNGLPRWHPAIKDSYIEHQLPSDKVGCIRNFTLKAGGRIREQLLALSDFDYSVTYSILESPMGVENYVATLKLSPITDGNRTFAEWSAEFDCAPARVEELAQNIGQGVFQGGFEALKTRLDTVDRQSVRKPARL
jgi:polyketide cyclase/dehydrase/lipid transport protein